MTTIAYRDGVLAADSLVTRNGVKTGLVDKLFELHAGAIGAGMGVATVVQQLVDWWNAGEDRLPQPKTEDGALVIILPDGSCRLYEDGGWSAAPRAEFHAWGCGAELAIGAMAAGAAAVEAVAIACRFDAHTGGPVVTLKL